jgi:hypothetical protein
MREKERSSTETPDMGQRDRMALPSSPRLWTRVDAKATCSPRASAMASRGSSP